MIAAVLALCLAGGAAACVVVWAIALGRALRYAQREASRAHVAAAAAMRLLGNAEGALRSVRNQTTEPSVSLSIDMALQDLTDVRREIVAGNQPKEQD